MSPTGHRGVIEVAAVGHHVSCFEQPSSIGVVAVTPSDSAHVMGWTATPQHRVDKADLATMAVLLGGAVNWNHRAPAVLLCTYPESLGWLTAFQEYDDVGRSDMARDLSGRVGADLTVAARTVADALDDGAAEIVYRSHWQNSRTLFRAAQVAAASFAAPHDRSAQRSMIQRVSRLAGRVEDMTLTRQVTPGGAWTIPEFRTSLGMGVFADSTPLGQDAVHRQLMDELTGVDRGTVALGTDAGVIMGSPRGRDSAISMWAICPDGSAQYGARFHGRAVSVVAAETLAVFLAASAHLGRDLDNLHRVVYTDASVAIQWVERAARTPRAWSEMSAALGRDAGCSTAWAEGVVAGYAEGEWELRKVKAHTGLLDPASRLNEACDKLATHALKAGECGATARMAREIADDLLPGFHIGSGQMRTSATPKQWTEWK